jgi:hypothetical protein
MYAMAMGAPITRVEDPTDDMSATHSKFLSRRQRH